MNASRRERRTRQRRASSLYLQFVNIRTGEPMGDLADISRDGFRLESTRPIRLRFEFAFRVDVPPDISDKHYIKLTARSLWSRPDPLDARLYDTGFEITGIDLGDVLALDRIVDRYAATSAAASSRTSYPWGR